MDIEQPSKFWQDLAEAHQQDLKRYGAETCKRHRATQVLHVALELGVDPTQRTDAVALLKY